LHYAVPFSLFAWSMLTLTAGYTSIINASSPLFAGLIAWAWMGERLDAGRFAGLAIGLAGVTVLVWDKLTIGSGSVVLATTAAITASFCYGLSAVLAKKLLAGIGSVAVAGGSMAAAAMVLLPLSFWAWPAVAPSATAWGMAAALGVACTSVAFVLYFRLIAAIGPTKAITVTFLIPVFAVVFAALFLEERISGLMAGGGALIGLGTALSTGLIRVGGLARVSRGVMARTLAILATLGFLTLHSSGANAGEWRFDLPVYLSANAFTQRADGDWDTFSTLAASAEFEFAQRRGPWLASLFAEYHGSADERVDGTIFSGLLAGYRRGDLDATVWWFSSHFPGASSRQTGMARIRHRLPNGHKFGVEYLCYREDWARGELKLGYYANFGSSMSVKVLAGARTGDSPEPLARLELSWRVR
jgi:drug/metabolite transporter (DMT)-like permease